MKNYGKVIEYDGYTGTIKSVDGINYLFTKNEVRESIKENDYVSFDSDIYQDVELTRYMARFVEKVKKEVL